MVLISTSGTAPANYYPAVIEASLSRVPLLILSADRPGFLVGTGANQTINQKNLYGDHVRYFADTGLPEKAFGNLQNLLEDGWKHAAGSEKKLPPGPVHLNFPFTEPLLPDHVDNSNLPDYSFNKVESKLSFSAEYSKLNQVKKPLIVFGPMEGNTHQKQILKLAEKINAAIFADPLSQLRYGFKSNLILSNYDHFLKFVKLEPDLIIRFGRKPTSKILCQLLEDWKKNTVLIDAWQQFNDDCPNYIQSPIGAYCETQINGIHWQGSEEWANYLLKVDKKVEEQINSKNDYFEGNIAQACFNQLKEDDQFFIGNSMPIRDVDMFTPTSEKKVMTFSNRGASGIDGVVSSALGACAEKEENSRSLLLIGDLSFYHDMNGLLAAKYGMNLTIVIINNSGGGIFSFLPISESGLENFQQYWTTDTGLDFEKAAGLYNCRYFRAENIMEIENAIQEAFQLKGVKIIEVRTDINQNVKVHRNFQKKVEKALTSI